MKDLWYTMVGYINIVMPYTITWRFWNVYIFGSVFSALISHIFLFTCERPCQPVCKILLHLPLCLHTSTHTHSSSVLKRQSLWKQRPPEKWRRERDELPLLWLHREWTLLITTKLRSQTFYCRYCRLLPHTHTSSLCLLLFSLAPLPSLSSLSQWGKVFSAPTVQALIRLSAARACGRSRRSREQGSLEENSFIST